MMRRALSAGMIGAAVAAAMTLVPVAAQAQYRGGWDGPRDGGGWHDGGGYRGGGGGYYRGGYDRGGYGRPGYGGRGYYGRHHRCNGTGGAIIGAIAGGLLGNSLAGYGDRTAGTVIGGGVGALAGNAIGRDC